VSDLFSDAARERAGDVAPLALRVRPQTLDEFVGQRHVLDEGSALRLAIEDDRVGSMILYGPPGSGKTTLARIVAARTGAVFEELSAVSATVANVRAVIAAARDRLGANGQRTILFLDEIHRFNKAQQDALLPAVEEGLVTLIGATTENPYFEVNSALLSRTQLYTLEPHTREDLELLARRGGADLDVELTDDVVAPIRVISPSSTAGRSASCWALLKRWISSRNRIVRWPFAPRRSRAAAITARTFATVAETAESSSKTAPVRAATMRASVVFPLPGGP